MNLRNGKQYFNQRRELWIPIWRNNYKCNKSLYVDTQCEKWILQTWF